MPGRRVASLFSASLIALTAIASPAAAQQIDRIVAFGDSYADTGIATSTMLGDPTAPASLKTLISTLYPTGRFSGGTNYVDTLADILNVPVENYAVGGALAGTFPVPFGTGVANNTNCGPAGVAGSAAICPLGFTYEVDQFLNVGAQDPLFPAGSGTFDESDLVVVSIGGNDARWSAPIALPFASATGLNAEDTCALVAFGGKLAVLWSNGPAGALFAGVRNDGDGDGVWTLETALGQASLVGDQIDLATSAGVLYALTRASGDTISLATRSTGGSWSVREVAKPSTGLFDPILVVDETFSLLRVFATAPTLEGASQSGGGTIFQKTASLSGAFPLGKGTPTRHLTPDT